MVGTIKIEPDDTSVFADLVRSAPRQPTLADVARVIMLEFPGLNVEFDEALGGNRVASVRIVSAEV